MVKLVVVGDSVGVVDRDDAVDGFWSHVIFVDNNHCQSIVDVSPVSSSD